MSRYWVIAPAESQPQESFEQTWQFDLANNVISIGWKEVGDVSRMSREGLAEAVGTRYPHKPMQTKGLFANMLWSFYHEIRPGDFLIARRGRKMLAGVGQVTGKAFYAPGKNPANDHPAFLSVKWESQPRNKLFPNFVFPMHTLAELSEEQFRSLVDSSGMTTVLEPEESVEDPSAFVLEKYLEEFIVSNFSTIFKGQLEIYRDPEGGDGQQYETEIGRIDILAIEPKSKTFVVIELKKGRPSDQVVGQVLRYMGWVKRNLCVNGEGVRGLVICRDADPRLTYALEMTRDIEVRYYSMSFRLNESP